MLVFSKLKGGKKRENQWGGCSGFGGEDFLERENFSLEIHAFGPWEFVETEGKTIYAGQASRGYRI